MLRHIIHTTLCLKNVTILILNNFYKLERF